MKGLSTERVRNKRAFLGWITRKVREKTAEMIEGEGRILDAGCGNGLFLAMLGLKGFERERLFGTDLSGNLLMEARGILEANKQGGIHLTRGDFFALPFKDNTFGVVVCLNTIVNIIDDRGVEGLIKEMGRVLASSGRIYVDIRNGDNPLMRWRYLIGRRKGGVDVRAYRLYEFIERLKAMCLDVSRIGYIGLKIRPFAYLLEIVKV